MKQPTSLVPFDQYDDPFDLNQIFIGREQQFDLFKIYLDRWKDLIIDAEPDDTRIISAPSPNDKIDGLVVLLYGRGGFGKSTLLRRYREIVLEKDSDWYPRSNKTMVSKVVDWEFAIEGKRSLFQNPSEHGIDADEYFKIICNQFAIALEKKTSDFKNYQKTLGKVKQAQQEAKPILIAMLKNEGQAALGLLAGEGLIKLFRWVAPRISQVLQFNNVQVAAKLKEIIGTGVQISAEQLVGLYTKLRDKLGDKIAYYLDPALQLGLALGRDLCEFAMDLPLLIFFDTYEEIDEGDHLLRIVMKSAGLRVGWILAGRDNLWAGVGQRERSTEVEYGYKEIVHPDRGLTIDFNAGGVGAFTFNDINEYFNQLCEKVQYEPPLPMLSKKGGKRLFDVTKGVPLAVKIAAGLYLETTSLDEITEEVGKKREIIDQMVRRYLLHTRTDPNQRAKLYALAMLGRSYQLAVAAALGLTPEEAETNYTNDLSLLHRRYSFIFSEKDEPALHEEVRYFLRAWLLQHRRDPEIEAINKRLSVAHESALKDLEERNQYGSLKERLLDDEWIEIYLNLTEQQFWLDPATGVRYCLPFMIAAVVYRPDVNKDADEIGSFFETQIRRPHNHWYQMAYKSLVRTRSRDSSRERLIGLRQLEEVIRLNPALLSFPSLSLDCQQELYAILLWQLGNAYRSEDDDKAVEYFEMALPILIEEDELRADAATRFWSKSQKLYRQRKYKEGVQLLDKAFALKPDIIWFEADEDVIVSLIGIDSESAPTYTSQGDDYAKFEEYERAIESYSHAIELDPNFAEAYLRRGGAYSYSKKWERALEDFSHAIELLTHDRAKEQEAHYIVISVHKRDNVDTSDATEYEPASKERETFKAYWSRGRAYNKLKKYEQAIEDYSHAIQLAPVNRENHPYQLYLSRGRAYNKLKKYEQAIEDYSHAIQLAPDNIQALIGLGYAYVHIEKYEQALEDFTRATQLAPNNVDAIHNRGTAFLLFEKYEQALQDLSYAIQLAPDRDEPYNSRGATYIKIEKYEQALEDFTRATQLSPNVAKFYINRGLVYL